MALVIWRSRSRRLISTKSRRKNLLGWKKRSILVTCGRGRVLRGTAPFEKCLRERWEACHKGERNPELQQPKVEIEKKIAISIIHIPHVLWYSRFHVVCDIRGEVGNVCINFVLAASRPPLQGDARTVHPLRYLCATKSKPGPPALTFVA